MTTIFRKVSIGLTKELATRLVKVKAIQIVAETDEGYEIHDTRLLRDQFGAPIKGKGIIRCFGTTHYVITKKYAEKLQAQWASET
jgi:hypothetical protein